MAELRERSMQAAQLMSQSGVDLSAAANASQGETGADRQPELRLDVTDTRGGSAAANQGRSRDGEGS